MANVNADIGVILLERAVISAAQLEEARSQQRRTGARLEDVLVRLGYATPEQVLSALAECHLLPFLDLTAVTIPPAIIELIPESVARENVVLPLAADRGTLWVVVSDPLDTEVIQKLQFILNKDIRPVLAGRAQIAEAINRHYGQTETESVDSMLAEFTDTAIDFTETDFGNSTNVEDEEAAPRPADGSVAELAQETIPDVSPPVVERQATVRYYHRMNPERMSPLLVVLSRKAVEEVVKRGVSQARSERFQVAADSLVEVEPIMPGCSCYPPKEMIAVRKEDITVTFWVVPHVIGTIMQARVVLRQDGRVLAEVPLQARVVKQSLTVLLGGLSLVLPFGLMVLKHFHLDFESQLADGFGLYAAFANWALRALSPELLAVVLLAATAGLYFWFRPRKRDVFWDVTTADTQTATAAEGQGFVRRRPEAEGPVARPLADTTARQQAALFAHGEEHYARHEYETALRFYGSGLALGPARARIYHHASVAAYRVGDLSRALALLQQAEATLTPAQMKGALWYNLGCFAARLGRLDDALHYLNRAVDRGYADPEKYRLDPDLASLRWRPDFKRLLVVLRT